jgi:hypothetical protein
MHVNDMKLEIIPHIGFGPVKLGMSREDVKSALGDEFYSGAHKNSDYYYSNSLQVGFLEGKADFIGISYSDKYEVLYRGKNVFDMEAHELFELIAQNENEEHNFNESEYLFPDQIVTLWDADEQYDRLGGEERLIWAQVGIGTTLYLEAVSKYA